MSYYPIIVPYLAVSDADAAIAFYKRAFGAEEKMRVPGENRGVMHAEVLINGGLVMLTDAAPEVGFPAAKPGDQVPVGIMVCWPRPEQVDEVFARAIGGRRQGRDRAPRRTLGRPLRGREGPVRPALVAACQAGRQGRRSRMTATRLRARSDRRPAERS